MKNPKKTILFSILICAAFVFISSAMTVRKTAEEKRAKALELLDNYAETQDNLKSFIIKFEASGDAMYAYPKNVKPTEYKKIYTSGEVRFDKGRTAERSYRWGDTGPYGQFITKDEASYASNLWDGQTFFKYRKRGKSSSLFLNVNERENRKFERDKRTIGCYPGAILMGTFQGDDANRVDSVIRKAKKIYVRDEMEEIEGTKCYVIDAVTDSGKYKLWIDPQHGYNIAKARIERRPGNMVDGRIWEKGRKLSVFLEIVHFQKINGLWLPVEADREDEEFFGFDAFYRSKGHIKLTEVILNPDHDALNSFVPDDIINGSRVYITGHINSRGGSIVYKWQDGNVVDESGKVIMSFREELNKAKKESQ